MLAGAQAAGAATWSAQSVPAPQLANGSIESVSCSSSTTCMAVGSAINPSGNELLLAETWNGTSWAIHSPASPANATANSLTGVSCTAASACTAVGTSNGTPLIYRWNGTSWAAETPATATGSSVTLSAVSCAAATSCEAAGDSFSSSSGTATETMVAERWNGTTWVLQAIASPTGTQQAYLTSISCKATTACTAVGAYATNGGGPSTAIAETYTGTSWVRHALAMPSGSTTSVLNGVSCSAAAACTAIGYYISSSGPGGTLAERWNGTAWKSQSVPGTNSYTGVSCPVATYCTAVGFVYSSAGGSTAQVPVAEKWNGSTWSSQTVPAPAHGGSFNGVSCTAANACTAVGSGGTSAGFLARTPQAHAAPSDAGTDTFGLSPADWSSLLKAAGHNDGTAAGASASASVYGESGPALADRWNGTSWAAQSPANVVGAAPSVLSATSCTASTSCLAVGDYSNPAIGQQLSLAERWNGSAWSVLVVPAVSGATSSSLTDVSCTAATACTAVGSYYTSTYVSMPVAERFNGTAWSIQTLAAPSNAQNITLRGVSCSSATACTAVGSYTSTSTFHSVPLAEQWNGSAWKLQTIPQPAAATGGSALSGVSCKTATTCTAAGSYTSNSAQSAAYEVTQVAGVWKVQTIALPAGTAYSLLGGVSCSAATACTAVGTYQGSSGSGAYAERYNGTAWKLQSIPSGAYVTQVSCATATACTAVGSDSAAGWNGTTWTVQQLGFPAGGGYPSVTGVSCISAIVCEASGSVFRAVSVPVAERYS
jgi:hypothetical protein